MSLMVEKEGVRKDEREGGRKSGRMGGRFGTWDLFVSKVMEAFQNN